MYKFVAIGLLFLLSCGTESQTTQKQPIKYLEYELLVIDDCEYLVCGLRGNGGDHTHSHSLTHKGNCKNPIHQCK